jgi:galactose oxidase-like protein
LRIRARVKTALPIAFATILSIPMAACSGGTAAPPDGGVEQPRADAGGSSNVHDDAQAASAPDAMSAPDAEAVDAAEPDAGLPAISPVWEARGSPPPTNPVQRWGAQMVFVPDQKRFIMFGGSHAPSRPTGDTWSYSVDSGTWTLVVTTNPPPPRYCHCLAYLPDQNQVLLVGGRSDTQALPPAAWTLDLATSTWTRVQGDAPPGVIGCMAAWMPDYPGGGRAIVFGGGGSRDVYNDTWAFDPAAQTFEKLMPAHSPPARGDGMARYDPGPAGGHGRVLIHAGVVQLFPTPHHLDDLWAFDGTDWSEVAVTGSKPSARRVQAQAFDAARREWLLFGGTIESMDYNDLWLFDANMGSWTQLPMDGAPLGRGFAAFGYVPGDDAYFMFGGLSQPIGNSLADGFRLRIRP